MSGEASSSFIVTNCCFSCFCSLLTFHSELYLLYLHHATARPSAHPSIRPSICPFIRLCASPPPPPRLLLLIQPASACSPTQFAIKTKFRALKPEGRWVSTQGTCCLATVGGTGDRRVYLSCGVQCGGRSVCSSPCLCVCGLDICWCLLILDSQ